MSRRAGSLAVLLALQLVAWPAFAEPAAGGSEAPRCAAPAGLAELEPALIHSAQHLAKSRSLTIVAVGSSSTQGVGASDPSHSYPARLEAELRARFPAAEIKVVNRGRGGEDVTEELARLAGDVIADHPDLVLWQLGTNAVLRRDDLAADSRQIQAGVALLKASGADIVLMDLQYAPRVLERSSYATMEQLLADTAAQENIGLFRRFALMRYWSGALPSGAAPIIGTDGLHMTDASYFCLATVLAQSLADNLTAAGATASRPAAPAAAVAGLAPGAAPLH